MFRGLGFGAREVDFQAEDYLIGNISFIFMKTQLQTINA